MSDYLFVGSTPADEPCAQVGSANYRDKARKECQAYQNQLIREFGNPPGEAKIVIKQQEHDFGFYLEVAVFYNEDNEEETGYAYQIEGAGSPRWDQAAKIELRLSHD